MRVRLVVPTSRSTAPDFAITSGMRNDPPISTSSPRETMTSPPSASAFSDSSTAAALLFTTMVATLALRRMQQARKQAIDVRIAFAAFAGRQIKFQVGVALRDFGNMLQRFLAQRRASEIGVQDDAGRIDHRPQRIRESVAELAFDLRAAHFRWPPQSAPHRASRRRLAERKSSSDCTSRLQRRAVSLASNQSLHFLVTQQFVDRRQQSKEIRFRRDSHLPPSLRNRRV